MDGIKHFENLIFDLLFLWKQTTDVKTHLIINIFTFMALLSLQSIKISILLIDTGSFLQDEEQ
jgi:hypothetical protein